MFTISHTDSISLFSLAVVKYLNLGHFKGRKGLICSPLETEIQMYWADAMRVPPAVLPLGSQCHGHMVRWKARVMGMALS